MEEIGHNRETIQQQIAYLGRGVLVLRIQDGLELMPTRVDWACRHGNYQQPLAKQPWEEKLRNDDNHSQ